MVRHFDQLTLTLDLWILVDRHDNFDALDRNSHSIAKIFRYKQLIVKELDFYLLALVDLFAHWHLH